MNIRYEDNKWKEKMRVKLDVNNMFEEFIGEKHGLKPKEVDEMIEEINKADENIKKQYKEGKLGFIDLPDKQDEVVEEIKDYADKNKDQFDNFVILGIGGSALGSIALQTALNDSYHNEKESKPNIYVPDNVDPDNFKSLLETLNLEKTIFNVISKSGTTPETMSLFMIAKKAVED